MLTLPVCIREDPDHSFLMFGPFAAVGSPSMRRLSLIRPLAIVGIIGTFCLALDRSIGRHGEGNHHVNLVRLHYWQFRTGWMP